jgi:hypothetical protein
MNTSLPLHGVFLPIIAIILIFSLPGTAPWKRAGFLLSVYLVGSMATTAGLFINLFVGEPSNRTEWALDLVSDPARRIWRDVQLNLLGLRRVYHATLVPAIHVPWVIAGAFLSGRVARGMALTTVAVIIVATVFDVLAPALMGVIPFPFSSLQYERIALFAPLLVGVAAGLALANHGNGWRPFLARWSVRLAAIAGVAQFSYLALGFSKVDLMAAMAEPERDALVQVEKAEDWPSWPGAFSKGLASVDKAALAKSAETFAAHFRSDSLACLLPVIGDARVVSHGFDPMIAPFHGIRAIDGYHNFYPLWYKHAFRPLIADKLAASDKLKHYFDDWGSRVQTMADRVPEVPPNYVAARRLGATFVLSDRPMTDENLQLEAMGCDGEAWLYRIAGD